MRIYKWWIVVFIGINILFITSANAKKYAPENFYGHWKFEKVEYAPNQGRASVDIDYLAKRCEGTFIKIYDDYFSDTFYNIGYPGYWIDMKDGNEFLYVYVGNRGGTPQVELKILDINTLLTESDGCIFTFIRINEK
jgi:hypothetical protein